MALAPKLSLCFEQGCTKIRVNDTTGTYSLSNTGGWDVPNITFADVVLATVSITLPKSSVPITLNVTTTVQNATIVDNKFLLDIIDATDLNVTELLDGEYTVVYTIVDLNNIEYTSTFKFFSTCKAACCVEKMKAKFKEWTCGCGEYYLIEEYYKAKTLLQNAKYAYACGKTSEANNILDSIERICKFKKCNC